MKLKNIPTKISFSTLIEDSDGPRWKTTQISFLKWNCYFANEWFWWENHSLDTLLSRFGFLRSAAGLEMSGTQFRKSKDFPNTLEPWSKHFSWLHFCSFGISVQSPCKSMFRIHWNFKLLSVLLCELCAILLITFSIFQQYLTDFKWFFGLKVNLVENILYFEFFFLSFSNVNFAYRMYISRRRNCCKYVSFTLTFLLLLLQCSYIGGIWCQISNTVPPHLLLEHLCKKSAAGRKKTFCNSVPISTLNVLIVAILCSFTRTL